LLPKNVKIKTHRRVTLPLECVECFGRKTSKNYQLERSRHRWEFNTKVDLKEREWEGMDWIYLAEHKGK
jgi:hypothetical protein